MDDHFALLTRWVSCLGQVAGLDLEFDEQRICTITYGEDIVLSLMPAEDDEDGFVIVGRVLDLTMDEAVDDLIVKAALKMNCLGNETHGGALGLSLYDEAILLVHGFSYSGCDEIVLANIVENLALEIDRLRTLLLEQTGFVRENPSPPSLPAGAIFV
ncbi:CesT family type III secretion system chaperone [uncultured Thiocystis sp.]|jgi:hypothetical protein|uniref:CesT family type III secretion system chaperone n=1 Tax=uncultured Thiocystis sp. TaxID=1202134 RepID=UPI0025D2C55A|nr:CesT family type III secretion system chaperone [uncultured Thiocystis sp.]